MTLDYTVFDIENNLLDSGATPLVYLHGGYGDVFEKLEKELEGKSVGESIHIQLLPQEAFGEYKQELVLVEERTMFEDDIDVGQNVEMVFSEDDGDDEMLLTYTVIEILEDRVILDANHPLAGVTIVFDGTVIGVREATSDEIEKRLLNHEEPLVAYQS